MQDPKARRYNPHGR